MGVPSLAQLALAGVISLIAFLGYGPQYLFHHIEPSALDQTQSIVFNYLLLCTWICYTRACFTDPGHVPRNWGSNGFLDEASDLDTASPQNRIRRCRKCENYKPPRAHHCKVCQKCIPKMDHHCPWTINCVSHRTFPHFFRFLFYSVTAMLYLEYFLYIRLAILFQNRSLPSYLGPTPLQMICLFTFTLTNSITLFALAVLLIRNIYTLASNTTTIESWEIERHDTLVRRARSHGGYLDGPDGQKIRLRRQEFPYDIGIYANVRQAMGTGVGTWLWPFAATPANEAGLAFETNGFEDPNTTWPPPDPDRLPRRTYNLAHLDDDPFIHNANNTSNIDIDAFRTRQRRDYQRFSSRSEEGDESQARKGDSRETGIRLDASEGRGGRWKDADGDCLGDFGVDDEEMDDEDDDIPLSEILARRGRGRKSE